MNHSTRRRRDRAMLKLLYASGGRVSEIVALTWCDLQPNGDSGQVTLIGKSEESA